MHSRRSLFSQLLAVGSLAAGLSPISQARAQSVGRIARGFVGIQGWLNVPDPLALAALRGKVVLIDFWTYSCINCRRTVPYLNRWQSEYGGQGLQIVGIHSPEFGFEHIRENVAEAIRDLGILFPVAQDNDFRTWRAWDNEAWPTFYLLDREGRVVMVRVGEDHARELEAAIRTLLGLEPSAAVPGDDPDLSRIGTPEIYFGAVHPTPQDRFQRPRQGNAVYVFPPAGPRLGEYQLDGTWLRQGEELMLRSGSGAVRMRFLAAKVHLVAAAPQSTTLHSEVSEGSDKALVIGRPTLYTLVDSTSYVEHEVLFNLQTAGVTLYSATFG